MNQAIKIALFFFCFFLLATSAFAVIKHDSMKVFAVTEDEQKAMTADLGLTIESGTGKVWSSVEPLIGTSTQTTEKIAIKISKNFFDRVDAYDYKFDINSTASLVDGPSAGAAMTLLAVSMLTDKQVPDNVGITGTITTDGSVGQVGGIFKKAQEAARIGIKLFLIPVGETKQTVKTDNGIESINLVDYAIKNWGLKVVEVANIDQVLKIAFSDIEKIDVNSAKTELPGFIPKPIAFSRPLGKMKELTNSYVKRAEDSLKTARTSLTGTLLNDPGIVDVLLVRLNDAEDNLQNAKNLFDQNYLYSAANYAFLSQISASFVNDISANPSIIDPSSTVLDLKLLDLKKKIDSMKSDLNSFVPVENWEWQIAAQQRLSWAEHKLDSLLEEKTIVIQIGGASDNSLLRVHDYEFAVAWFDVSKDFYSFAKVSGKQAKQKPIFQEEINSYIINSENNLSSLNADETKDISRRLETAKRENAFGWSVPALFDSASAFALSEAELINKENDLGQLTTMLEQKIFELQAKISEKNTDFIWAQLYLDHAKYYLQGIAFYKENSMNASALDMAKSGLSLAFLAEETFNASSKAQDYYSSIPSSELSEITVPPAENVFAFDKLIPIIALFAIVFAAAIIFIFLRFKSMQPGKATVQSVQNAKARLDSLFATKKISYEKYIEINSILENRLEEIAREKEALSTSTIELEKTTFELQALQKILHSLEKQSAKGVVTKKDFEENTREIMQKISAMRKAILEENKDIAFEKKRLVKDTGLFNKEAREIIAKSEKQKKASKKQSAKKANKTNNAKKTKKKK